MTVSSTPTRLFGDPAGGEASSDAMRGGAGGATGSAGSDGPSGSGGSAGSGGSSSRAPGRSPSGSSPTVRRAHDPQEEAHFFPGQRLGDRYRIGALIGKGGMGEVYRADDLKLGQPVALKLLPPALALDPDLLERFYAEVRLARQVSHPNVCRVYDVAEIEGRQVLTMELIDGEDLATLLRRIGRLAPDKAVEIARQICAGLAAAHDRGILHRDLKPANIMLDGRGRARITDFGLAAIAGSVKGLEIQSGTPIYMSPEQLEGRDVTVRSDVYSLGVVLYEIFTGKRVYDAKSMSQLVQQQEWSRPSSVSAHLETIDPVIERVILRCLEKDPANRPPNALAVAAGLPGGDPLAAALAAGETPSPEMVAAAGGEGALAFPVAAGLLSAFVIGLVTIAFITSWTTLLGRAGSGKPPSVLGDKARDILAKAGYTEPPVDTAFAFATNWDYLEWLRGREGPPVRWDALARAQKPAIVYWYREAPNPLQAENPAGVVWPNDPPQIITGMKTVVLDWWGRLSSLTAVPPQVAVTGASGGKPADAASLVPTGRSEPASAVAQGSAAGAPSVAGAGSAASQAPASERAPDSGAPSPPAPAAGAASESAPKTVDWSPLFEAAGLDMRAFHPTTSQWLPLYYADTRQAWEGPLPWEEGATARVETASYAGRPVYFSVVGPWAKPRRSELSQQTPSERLGQALNVIFFIMLLAGIIVLGRWNIRTGRGDRRGAFRLALFLFLIGMVAWVLRADHVAALRGEWDLFVRAAAMGLFDAGLVWLLYMALEPFVRWRWPDSIVGWTRLLGGGFRDPLVGRDILVGSLFGVGMTLIWRSRPLLEAILAGRQSIPPAPGIEELKGPGWFLAGLIDGQKDGITSAMILLFFLFIGMLGGARRWPALIFGAIGTLMTFLYTPSTSLPARLIIAVWSAVLLTWVLLRWGALAAIAAHTIRNWAAPLSLDLSAWYAPQMIVLWILLVALGGYAFWIALGRRHHLALPRPRGT